MWENHSQIEQQAAAADSIENEVVYANSPVTRKKVSDVFTREEIRELTRRSDWMGAWAIVMTWGGVCLIMAAMVYASHRPLWASIPATLVGMLFLAGRQLSLSIIVHDASHGTLFKTKWMNSVLTDWLCARPLWNDLGKYRPYHFVHHTRTATSEDPDLILRSGYPTSKSSMARKFFRDINGWVGIRYFIGRILMDAGLLKWTVTGEINWLPRTSKRWYHFVIHAIREATPMLLCNAVFAGILYAIDELWLLACWWGAHFTFFMLLMRIRSMAEHAATELSTDMFRNTRTVRAGWLARALVAPIGVNFHMEHHILASCPWFRLAKAHRMLRERGAVPEPPGYWQMLGIMTRGEQHRPDIQSVA